MVHDLGQGLWGSDSECPGLLLGFSYLIPLALGEAQQQYIEAILIFWEWTGATMWHRLVELRSEIAPLCLSAAVTCLRFPKGLQRGNPQDGPILQF